MRRLLDREGCMGSELIFLDVDEIVRGIWDVGVASIISLAALVGFPMSSVGATVFEMLGVGIIDADVFGPRSPSPHPSSLSQLLLFVVSPDPS